MQLGDRCDQVGASECSCQQRGLKHLETLTVVGGLEAVNKSMITIRKPTVNWNGAGGRRMGNE